MNAHAIDYATVSSRDRALLDKHILRKLQDGWELYGSPYGNDCYFNQAMVKWQQEVSAQIDEPLPQPPYVFDLVK